MITIVIVVVVIFLYAIYENFVETKANLSIKGDDDDE